MCLGLYRLGRRYSGHSRRAAPSNPTAHQKEAFRRAAAQTRLLPPWVRRSSFPRAAGSVSVPARLPNARLGHRLLLADPRPRAPLMIFEAQLVHGGITNAASRCAEHVVVTLP